MARGRCKTSIAEYIETKEKENQVPSKCILSSPSTENAHTGSTLRRPCVSYPTANASTKRRMKASAKKLLSSVVDQCNAFSCGKGQQLLQDAAINTPLRKKKISENDYLRKVNTVFGGVSETHKKESRGSNGRIRLPSVLAPRFKNK